MTLSNHSLIATNNARQLAILDSRDGKVSWVGDLMSPKELSSTKPRVVRFLPPFVNNTESNNVEINVVGNNGYIYKFSLDENRSVLELPKIISTNSKISYSIDLPDGIGFISGNRLIYSR